ncbi:MAG: dipeptidase [Bryobacterales bacterium]|nr:dipeptidase [Bryobacteraceae bacterium]MDW8131491.1 dipeptidase [Bryobacterales bacterium]
MTRREMNLALLGMAFSGKGPFRQPLAEEAARIHRELLLADTHNDAALRVIAGADIGKRSSKGHTDVPRLREGGVGAVFFAAWVSPRYVPLNQAARRALELIDVIRRDIVARYPEHFELALTADDIEAARRRDRIAVLISVEGGHAIEDNLRVLRAFYDLGVRSMTLTHANTNNWADSSGDERDPRVKRHNGLTEFGRQVIAEMNRLGMIVDVSHASDKTFWDVLEASRAPVMASHSCCRALCDHPRNLADPMIRALAAKGGLIQIAFVPEYLTRRKDPPASVEDVAAHIEHAVRVAGVDAVGIGSDFDGISRGPVGLEDVSKFPALTRALLARGFSVEELRKIYGGNLLRLMRAVEDLARRAR